MNYRPHTFFDAPRNPADILRTLAVSLQLNSTINLIASNKPATNTEEFIAAVRAQLPIIREEIKETIKALTYPETAKPNELADGLADIIVTVDGLRFRCGLTLNTLTDGITSIRSQSTFHHSTRAASSCDRWRKTFADKDIKFLEPHQYESGTNVDAWETIDSLHDALDLLETLNSIFEADVFSGLSSPEHMIEALKFPLDVFCALCYCTTKTIAETFSLSLAFGQHLVYRSNLSKFDTDEATALLGLEKYQNLGIDVALYPATVNGITYHVIKSSRDQTVGDKHYPQGKFLKSVNFREPNWNEEPKPYLVYMTDGNLLDLSSVVRYDPGSAFPVSMVFEWYCFHCGTQHYTKIEVDAEGAGDFEYACQCGYIHTSVKALEDQATRTGIDAGDTVRASV